MTKGALFIELRHRTVARRYRLIIKEVMERTPAAVTTVFMTHVKGMQYIQYIHLYLHTKLKISVEFYKIQFGGENMTTFI